MKVFFLHNMLTICKVSVGARTRSHATLNTALRMTDIATATKSH